MHLTTDLARRLLVPIGISALVLAGTAVGVMLATAAGRAAAQVAAMTLSRPG